MTYGLCGDWCCGLLVFCLYVDLPANVHLISYYSAPGDRLGIFVIFLSS